MSVIQNEELAAFVTSTLNAIAFGVGESVGLGQMHFDVPKEVEFEVAVTATKSKEAGGGFKIQVFSAEGKAAAEDEHVSRIRFTVGRVNSSMVGRLDTSVLKKGIA